MNKSGTFCSPLSGWQAAPREGESFFFSSYFVFPYFAFTYFVFPYFLFLIHGGRIFFLFVLFYISHFVFLILIQGGGLFSFCISYLIPYFVFLFCIHFVFLIHGDVVSRPFSNFFSFVFCEKSLILQLQSVFANCDFCFLK